MEELIFKLPTGKLPFIGIVFETENRAGALNQELVLKFTDTKFAITLHPVSGRMDLVISGLNMSGIYYEYTGLKYDKKQMVNFLEHISDRTSFTFGHLVKNDWKEVLVKTQGDKRWFKITVESLSIQL